MLNTDLYIIEGFIEMRCFSKIWLGSVDAVNLLNPAMFKCLVGPGRNRSDSVFLKKKHLSMNLFVFCGVHVHVSVS